MTTPLLTATIDLAAVAHNVGVLRESSGTDVMAVVKADGYGHGAEAVGRAALAAGATALGTAQLTEALDLRAAGVDAPLTAWLLTQTSDFAAGIAADVDLAVSSPRALAAVVDAARRTGRQATVTLKVDTGLGRNGIAADEWQATAIATAKAIADQSVRLRAVMCHLARGDEPDHPLNSEQAERLDRCVADLRRLSVAPEVVHIANSPAALTRRDLARDLVRPGIAVYGRTPVPDISDFGLIPAMTLTAQVVLVKRISAGDGVSYGHTWVADRDTTIAILPAGYADGVPRLLSNQLEVSVNGRRFRNVGRICMDQFVIDLGPDGGGVREGDTAVLFGTGAGGEPTALDWARMVGTIDYEIVSGIRGRRVRRYVGAGADHSGVADQRGSDADLRAGGTTG
ncbi:alanine racemase [Williamsia sterculiae]|uniref:Alanine racemase n=1 Tax=Williamsia sterculiae TaxID=1344003 RepID=A0A1N7DUF5_9NOCA|nr:alanine racemase [Williamsia sterculiae]SIR79446.1 alanine racemase [Williamsia sterculiae]